MTTAVVIRCPRGHKIATLDPFPAHGPATQMMLTVEPARYRGGMAGYLRPEADTDTGAGWVTVDRSSQRLTIEDFSSGRWARSVTWACRCGLNQLDDPQQVIRAAWSWSNKRRARHGNPPPPERVALSRRT